MYENYRIVYGIIKFRIDKTVKGKDKNVYSTFPNNILLVINDIRKPRSKEDHNVSSSN